jgi:hypothetical protein
VKYFAGGLAMTMMLVTVVLVIRHQTSEIQQTVKESAREAARQGVDAAVEHAPETAQKAAGRVLDDIFRPGQSRTPQDPTRTPPEQQKAPQEPSSKAPEEASSKPPEEPSSKAPDEQAKAPQERPRPTDSSPLPQLPVPRMDPVGIVGGILDTAAHAAKTVDDFGQEFLPIDDEQERELGREVHRIVLKNQKRIDNPSAEARFKELAGPILAIRGRKGVNYTFTFLNDPTVNAFSHVGGYIYIHKGLLEVARTDIELQFVLGHEIGHVDLKHVLRGFTYSLPIGKWSHEVVAQLAQIAYYRIAVGYNQELEFEADEYGFRRMLKIGRTRDEALAFPTHFARYAVEKGWDKGNRRSDSVPGGVLQEVQNHFKTHPPADQRLKRLEGLKV